VIGVLSADRRHDLLMTRCRQTSYKKHIEYLFWIWDPQLTPGRNELLQTLEEGFMSADTYCVIETNVCCSPFFQTF